MSKDGTEAKEMIMSLMGGKPKHAAIMIPTQEAHLIQMKCRACVDSARDRFYDDCPAHCTNGMREHMIGMPDKQPMQFRKSIYPMACDEAYYLAKNSPFKKGKYQATRRRLQASGAECL